MLPMECITDSKSLFEALRSNKIITEKQLRVELCGMKQMIELKQSEYKVHRADSQIEKDRPSLFAQDLKCPHPECTSKYRPGQARVIYIGS